jgi:transposase-like protein
MQHICYSSSIMLIRQGNPDTGNEQTIELIAERVIAALREDLETIATKLSATPNPTEQLTVGQVARRLGVARSTVYAHWREWGGYKLGRGEKAPIRFDSTALPIVRPSLAPHPPLAVEFSPTPARRRRRRRDLIVAAPRLAKTLDGRP